MSDLKARIAQRMKARRQYLGMQQHEVARALGIGRSGYQAWESGRVDIAIADIARLATIMRTTPGYFLDDDPPEVTIDAQAEPVAQSMYGFLKGQPAPISRRAADRLRELMEEDEAMNGD